MEQATVSPGLIAISVMMFFASFAYAHYANEVMKKPVTMFTSSSIPLIVAWKTLTLVGCACGFVATIVLGPLVLGIQVLRLYEFEEPSALLVFLTRLNLMKIGIILFVLSWLCMLAAHFIGAKPLKKM